MTLKDFNFNASIPIKEQLLYKKEYPSITLEYRFNSYKGTIVMSIATISVNCSNASIPIKEQLLLDTQKLREDYNASIPIKEQLL